MGGHDDDGQGLRVLRAVEAFEDVEAGEFRQSQIQQHDMGRFLRDLVECLLPVPRDHRGVVQRVQPIFQHGDDVGVVVNDEDFGVHALTSLTQNA
jgi:hypothetical protein